MNSRKAASFVTTAPHTQRLRDAHGPVEFVLGENEKINKLF
jgi:hypothetical protein